MNADGTGQRRLTYTVKEAPVVWSPDGKQLAFIRAMDRNSEIFVMNADGSNQRRLAPQPVLNYSPAWSPDSRQIAYLVQKPGLLSEIHLANVETHIDQLLDASGRDDAPSWSPDGSHLALRRVSKLYESVGLAYTDIYVMGKDGTKLRPLTQDMQVAVEPQWSPDGTQIAYVASKVESADLVVMNNDGSKRRLLTQSGFVSSPRWSPDSKSIVFVLSTPQGASSVSDIVVLDVSTGALRYLTNDAGTNKTPGWSPDGKTITFVSQRGTLPPQIYLIHADGTGLTELTTSVEGNAYPAWQP